MNETLITAIAFVFIIEGVLPAFFPNRWQRYLKKIANESITSIRQIGLFLMTIGFIILLFNS